MQTNAFRGTLDQPDQGPAFAPEVNRHIALDILKPKHNTCCDCCCGGSGQGCGLVDGIRAFSVWFAIVAGGMLICFAWLATERALASSAFFVLVYGLIHGMCALEGFRLINFQNAQEYHVRGKRLHAIYTINATLNSSIATALVIIGIQYMVFWGAWGFLFIIVYGGPLIAHAIVCYRSLKVLRQFFELHRYQAHQKLQQQG